MEPANEAILTKRDDNVIVSCARGDDDRVGSLFLELMSLWVVICRREGGRGQSKLTM